MKLDIDISSAAERDLDGHARYIEDRDPAAAERFYRSAQRTFDKLADYKFLGSRYEAKRDDLTGLRVWAIDGFPKHLIFFDVHSDRITIARIVHASQDWRKT